MTLPWLALLLGCGTPIQAPGPLEGPGRLLAQLDNPTVTESSGLALASTPDHFWTHNDSGGLPELYAFDAQGRARGTWKVAGAKAVDWEELAGFTLDSQRWLLVADTGDNDRKRDHLTLYFVKEPAHDGTSGTVPVSRTTAFRFPDGAHDCEAVTVDPVSRTILLITKDRGEGTKVFRLPLVAPGKAILQATPLTSLELAPKGDMSGRRAVALDLSPDGTKVALLTYTRAWIWDREPREPWEMTFSRPASRELELPVLEQGEALAWSADGTRLLLTSEGSPMPLVAIDL